MQVFQIGKEKQILGVVKGLVSESEKVEEFLRKFQPDVIGLGVSSEEIEGLKDYIKKGGELPPLSEIEEIYADKLAAYGDVGYPPPAFERCVVYSTNNGISILPLDIPEEKFTELYCRTVHTRDLIFQSFRIKRLRKKKIDAQQPEEFEIAWDKLINRFGGFKVVEIEREKHMAEELKQLSGRVVAVIEVARAPGVARRLGWRPQEEKK